MREFHQNFPAFLELSGEDAAERQRAANEREGYAVVLTAELFVAFSSAALCNRCLESPILRQCLYRGSTRLLAQYAGVSLARGLAGYL